MTADDIIAGLERDLEERVRAAAEQFAAEVDDLLSVQAPITLAMPGTFGSSRAVRAATPATPGAPPRMVTGTLRRSMRTRKAGRFEWQVGNFGGGAPYGSRLELEMGHRFLGAAAESFRFEEGRFSRYGFGPGGVPD